MSSLPELHPSYLALDRASLGHAVADVQRHLDDCQECRAYVESLRAPASVRGLSDVRERIQQGPRSSQTRRWLWLSSGAMAAAAALTLFLRLRPQPGASTEPLYIGDKGFSSVWIYVRHGNATALWDGKKPVFAGDRLRLKVDPGRFKQVVVYSVKNPNAPELLYGGSLLPGQSVTLPDAWEVDAESGAERLLVAFSSEPVKPTWSEWLRGKAPPGVVLLPFVLPKSSPTDPSSGSTAP